MRNHGLLDLTDRPVWKVIRGGASRYVEALVEPFRHRIRLREPVCEVRRKQGSVDVRTQNGGIEPFDDVVIALHGDRVLEILVDAADDERALFEKIRYVDNEVVLHTDGRFLPRSPHARACWNAAVRRDPAAPVVVTYDLNLLQRLGASRPICVSLNAGDEIAQHAVLRRLHYRHPVLDVDAVTRMHRIDSLSGRNRVHYCGAYVGYGFHEDGVRSAMAASEAILARRA
jgi:predicted NAD/FAD-binding protein